MADAIFSLPAARQDRSRASRARLVEAAAALLNHRAWDDISIEDIVEEAGLSVGAFYKRFKVKDDVLAACIEEALAKGRSQAAQMICIKGDLGERVRALVQTLASGWVRGAGVVRAAKAMRNRDHVHALNAESAATQARITDWLLEHRAAFGHPDPETAIRMAFALPLAALQLNMIDPKRSHAEHATLIAETTTVLLCYFGYGEPWSQPSGSAPSD